MTDYFALLGQPRKPWLNPEKLREQYQQLILSEHPDLQPNGRDAPPTFAAVNEGYKVLNNPRLRLKHLLTLEGNAPAPAASVPLEVTDLFTDTGALIRDIDVLLQQMGAATALTKSILRPQMLTLRERTNVLLKRLQSLYENGIQELERLDKAWEKEPEKAIRELAILYRRFAYLERWIEQLKERQFELSS
jgi:curved DNA-binding protein CbpA